MFVHLGGNTVIDVRQVVAILDARRLQGTPGARLILERTQGGRPRDATVWAEARAIVVTTEGVYPSPIAPATVAKRIQLLGRFSFRKTAER